MTVFKHLIEQALEIRNFQGFLCCVDADGADMLDEERIRLMTKMASYEEGEGKDYIPIKQYYRKDYVVLGMLKTFITSSIAFGILFVCVVLYEMDNITEILSDRNPAELGMYVLAIYIGFAAIYQVIALFVYNRRYTKANASIKEYYSVIKRVEKLQQREEKPLSLED